MRLKLRAMRLLMEAGVPVPVTRFRSDLLEVMLNPRDDWQGARNAVAAERLLKLVDGIKEYDEPSETPNATADEDYWHPEPAGSYWREFDACDTQGRRDYWRARLEGPPEDGWEVDDEAA
jgi:hypothetical protein